MSAFVDENHGLELFPLAWNPLFSLELSQFSAANHIHLAEKRSGTV
jgi:hypothetical protein